MRRAIGMFVGVLGLACGSLAQADARLEWDCHSEFTQIEIHREGGGGALIADIYRLSTGTGRFGRHLAWPELERGGISLREEVQANLTRVLRGQDFLLLIKRFDSEGSFVGHLKSARGPQPGQLLETLTCDRASPKG